MSRKDMAQVIAIIICLLPSPLICILLLTTAGAVREYYQLSPFLVLFIGAVVGLVAFLFTYWVISKLIYFIIK